MNTLSSILKFIAENIAPIVGTHSSNTVLAAPMGSTGVPTFRSLGASDIPNVVRPPIGSVSMYAGASAPSGWMLCNGQAVSRTTYSALYSIIGTTYGSGDGSTTFNLPDLRDRVAVGAGTTYSRNSKGGSASISYTPKGTNSGGAVGGRAITVAQMPSHNHNSRSLTGTFHSITYEAGSASGSGIVTKTSGTSNWKGNDSGTACGTAYWSINATHTHDSQGSGQTHDHPFTQPTFTGTAQTLDVRQPYIGVNFIIYTGVA